MALRIKGDMVSQVRPVGLTALPRGINMKLTFPEPTVTDSATSATGSAEPRRLAAADAHDLLATGRAVLADVRDHALYQNSHPAGAVSLPHAAVQAAGGQLPSGFPLPDDAVLIVYCA